MKAIIITGTPGTGKTTLANYLSKHLSLPILDINTYAKEHNLLESYDKKRKTYIIDETLISRKIASFLAKSKTQYIVDGHISHFLHPKSVSTCLVTNTKLSILKKRLEKRGYNKLKVAENLESEAFNECLLEAQEMGHNPISCQMDTKRSLKPILAQIKLNKSKNKLV